MKPGYFNYSEDGAGVSVVGFRRTGTRRVLIKRSINSSEINASLCFLGRAEKRKTRKLSREKKRERDKRKKRKGGEEEGNGLLVHPRRESYIRKSEKKGKHGRIPRIQEDYLVSAARG